MTTWSPISNLSINSRSFASTLDYSDHPHFAAQAHFVIPSSMGAETLLDELRRFGRVLRAAYQEKVLLVESSSGRWYPDLVATAVVGLWPKRYRPVVVLMGAMWEPDQGLRHLVQRLIVKLADRAIQLYSVQSSAELELFPQTWGVARSKMRFCPYFFTLTRRDLEAVTPRPGDYVFAGGNSHRDYGALVEAARQLPELRFIIATNRLRDYKDLPPNVTAGPVSHPEFMSLMYSAAAVVIPMVGGLHRAAGQQSYLNAMWLGKPTIVTDSLGVRDHIEDSKTGLVIDNSAESLVRALRWVFDPANKNDVIKMGALAKKIVSKQFAFENHATRLLAIVNEAIREAASSGQGS